MVVFNRNGVHQHMILLMCNVVKTVYGEIEYFPVGKSVRCILSLYLFNIHTECMKRKSGLDLNKSGLKMDGRNINHLRYVDGSTLLAKNRGERLQMTTDGG